MTQHNTGIPEKCLGIHKIQLTKMCLLEFLEKMRAFRSKLRIQIKSNTNSKWKIRGFSTMACP